MSAITTSTGRFPVSGASIAVIMAASSGAGTAQRERICTITRPSRDHDALDLAAGQIGGDPAERAAVKPGHARARPDGRGDGVDIDTVYDGGSGSAVRWRHGHATREGVS